MKFETGITLHTAFYSKYEDFLISISISKLIQKYINKSHSMPADFALIFPVVFGSFLDLFLSLFDLSGDIKPLARPPLPHDVKGLFDLMGFMPRSVPGPAVCMGPLSSGSLIGWIHTSTTTAYSKMLMPSCS